MARPTLVAQPRRTPEQFVLSRTDDGCLVYAATDPQHVYLVAGTSDRPTCTCPDARAHQADAAYRCAHMREVHPTALPNTNSAVTELADERAAIQAESRPRKAKANGNGHSHLPTQMILKRSISPDGRIDSLSVEFTCPVDGLAPDVMLARAANTLDLQAQIVSAFVPSKPPANGGNGHDVTDEQPLQGDSGRLPATLLAVGGMDGKWGRRLFLTVQVNGRNAKLFGSPKQLQAALATAGYPDATVAEGATLNLPCQVVAAPSPDGRYLNIMQVFPAIGSDRRTA
jgi:hypothetical protein